jgi:hypothetical protein
MHVWLKLQYVQQKSSGQFFYRRRIPDNVQKHYQGKTHFQKSLKTKDVQIAKDSSERLSESLDILWMYFTNPESVSLPQNQRQTATALLKEQHGLEPAEGQKIVGHYSDGAPITAIEGVIVKSGV